MGHIFDENLKKWLFGLIFLQKFNSPKFGCKSYVYIGFDRPAILENRGEIRTITKLDDQLNHCNSTNPSSTCNNQIYKLQLPSTGKWFKILHINFGQKNDVDYNLVVGYSMWTVQKIQEIIQILPVLNYAIRLTMVPPI